MRIILLDEDEDYLLTMASEDAIVASSPAALLPYRPTNVVGQDRGDKKFEIVLYDVESVNDDTEEDDVMVSCPPYNSDGCLVVALGEHVRCQTGAGFPNISVPPHVKISKRKQKITITLEKATRGFWMETWLSLRKKPRETGTELTPIT